MKTPIEIPCVILCGGKSSRMGEDKALLPFSTSNTLTQYQLDRLTPYFKDIYLSSKIDKFNFLNGDFKKTNLILDKDEIFSPIVALKTILESINAPKVFILSVDTPFVKIDTILELINASDGFNIVIAETEKTHNLCGVYDKSCLVIIDDMLKKDIHKVNYLIKQMHTRIIQFTDDNEFLNINNKDEYKKAKLYIN
jgi:molybdenum cofactor guanylyltransferase